MTNNETDILISIDKQILLHEKLDLITELLLILLKENQPNTVVQYMLLFEELQNRAEELNLK